MAEILQLLPPRSQTRSEQPEHWEQTEQPEKAELDDSEYDEDDWFVPDQKGHHAHDEPDWFEEASEYDDDDIDWASGSESPQDSQDNTAPNFNMFDFEDIKQQQQQADEADADQAHSASMNDFDSEDHTSHTIDDEQDYEDDEDFFNQIKQDEEAVKDVHVDLTEEKFEQGAALSNKMLSGLSALAGACNGVACMFHFHGLESVASGVSSGTGLAGLGGFGSGGSVGISSGLRYNSDGSVTFSAQELQQRTGMSASGIRSGIESGTLSIGDLLNNLFGEGTDVMFGFGLIGGIIQDIFDLFPTSGSSSGSGSLAAAA